MNYYERHIGDYIKDTAHLSLLEHGVYARLMDVYYLREGGIPKDQAYRLVSATSKAEKSAVDVILRDHFAMHDGMWIQKRCEEVIAEYHAFVSKQSAAGKASAAKRASNTGSTTVQPPLDSGTNQTPNQIQPPTSHSPIPNQSKSELRSSDTSRGCRIPDDFLLTDERRAVASAEGIDPDRTFASFRDFWIAKPGAGGRKVDWDATWRVWCRNEDSPRKPQESSRGLPRLNVG